MPRQLSRSGLRIQYVSKPKEVAERRVKVVAFLNRRSNFEWVAQRYKDRGFDVASVEHLHPEWQQATDPGILKDEKPRRAKLIGDRGDRLPHKFIGPRGAEPTGIEL